MFDQQWVDARRRGGMPAWLLADLDALGIAAGKLQHCVGHQAVVEDHVGFVEQAQRAQGQQAGIAGSGADQCDRAGCVRRRVEGKSMFERSEVHTSELQSLMRISYAVFCLKKKNKLSP